MLAVGHNLIAMNAQRQFNINTKKRAQSTEKLSSGYKINRAADDAAGLSISEKMRRQIRGLNQGTRNAEDGVSWVQTGDGAMNEAHDILQRMSELSVQALNETNSDSDRMALQREFDALQSELDRITETTKFNELKIFQKHDATYYQCEGDVRWEPDQRHVITDGRNDLTIRYRKTENSPQSTITITVPEGQYTTQELMDEIETELEKKNASGEGIMFEYNSDGYCNMNLEGGEIIDSVSGALSYLMYDMYEGGSFGALIGTTDLSSGTLAVSQGNNDHLEFTIEDFDGNITTKSITIPPGRYTREKVIDLLNDQLKDTSVKASAYGTGIKLGGDEAIVTGFKGNMFKIDGGTHPYNSVFYDNVQYGSVSMNSGYFRGGYVLTTDSKDAEHGFYQIDSSNNTLTLQPNGMASSVSLTIPDGRYTASEMATKLNELFNAQGLKLNVSAVTLWGFSGLRIESQTEGLDSKVNIDKTSSAYNTLFVTKEYNVYSGGAVLTNENTADREAGFAGSKDLSGLSTMPLTVTAGVNDGFTLTIDGVSSNITMTAKTYTSISDVVTELNSLFTGAGAAVVYKDKVVAEVSGNNIVIKGKAGSGLKNISVSQIAGNSGFDEIFQGYSITYQKQNATGTGSVTLNTPYDGTVDASDSSFKVNVGGKDYTVPLSTGNMTQDDIKKAIEKAVPETTDTKPNTFQGTVFATGNTDSSKLYAPKTAVGNTNVVPWNARSVGYSEWFEGKNQLKNDIPAKITIGPKLTDNMVVGDNNNKISLTINGQQRVMVLDNGTYNKSSLVAALQSKINSSFGNGYGGAIVSVDGDNLVIEARTDESYHGEDTELYCGTSDSSFLAELNTTRTAAKLTTPIELAASITIDNTCNEFKFNYTEKGVSKDVTLTLSDGTYTRSSLVDEINRQLTAAGLGVTAGLSSNCLMLTSKAVGNDVSISYGTKTGGSSSSVLFGDLITKTPARDVINLKTEDSIVIDGSTNQFTIRVNGADRTVTLDNGTYTREGFKDMLNTKLTAANAGVQAYISGDKLGFETVLSGSQQSFSITYNGGGSSMKAIYGETTTVYPGLKVSFTSGGNMVLTSTDPNASITVPSTKDGAFQQDKEIVTPIATKAQSGYYSSVHANIDGVNLTGDVTIDQWNDNLKFTFNDNGTTTTVNIDVPDGVYAHADLQTKLQELIDAQTGSGRLNVTVDGNGVKIEAVDAGSNYRLSSPSGDFYDKVMCKCTERTENTTPSVKDGEQFVSTAFAVGRKDVLSEGAEIRKGISDELSFDFTVNGTVHKIKMTLDAGQYSGEGIRNHIQQKLNEQLTKLGFKENLVEVGLGDVSTGVYGAKDDRAINFKLSKSVSVPEKGNYIIDGVSGNAAFEVFYQTDGKLVEAYVTGTKNVSGGVDIRQGDNELHFVVDDQEYDITVGVGGYSAEGIIDELNKQFDKEGVPLAASLDDKGRVRVSHRRLGAHKIQEISGSARDDIFFRENGENKQAVGTRIQLSSDVEDYLEIDRVSLNTSFLGINSICISKVKNAEKALDRISAAIDKISGVRSGFGTMQNRLEHAINSNKNKAENTQYAESRIRDTDMAEEMVRLSNLNILHQAGQSMMAQANNSNQGVLALLQV